jgi:hypothetical protein
LEYRKVWLHAMGVHAREWGLQNFWTGRNTQGVVQNYWVARGLGVLGWLGVIIRWAYCPDFTVPRDGYGWSKMLEPTAVFIVGDGAGLQLEMGKTC